MYPGVSPAVRKDGTQYFRAGLTFKRKHISLGSFDKEVAAHRAYVEGLAIINDRTASVEGLKTEELFLSFEKAVSLINFRDNGLYFKTPIYLRSNYFEYWYDPVTTYKFDVDDLFYYSGHKLQKRGGHLFVSEYGMQTALLSRYGIKPWAVKGRDYEFVNGDETDLRYSNVRVLNPYFGVEMDKTSIPPIFKTRIHINGNYLVGCYSSAEEAAIAYNRAVDLAKNAGINKDFSTNFIEKLSPREYARIYSEVRISEKYLDYLKSF